MTVTVNFGSNWLSILNVVEENVKNPIGSNVKLCRVIPAMFDGAQKKPYIILKGAT